MSGNNMGDLSISSVAEAALGPRDELALDRTRLASERNLMAWIRTSLSMISFGFGLEQFFAYLHHTNSAIALRMGQGPRYVGMALIFLGTFVMLMAALVHWRTITKLNRGDIVFRSRWSLGLLVALLLFALGVGALVNVVSRW